MEAKLLAALRCEPGARVLDAGCGAGHVALYMAEHGGLDVEAIDLVPRHVAAAARNVRRAGLEKRVNVRLVDYHDLSAFSDGSFDAVYTMETLVHAADPQAALREFFRVLRFGGRIAMHEYDHEPEERFSGEFAGFGVEIGVSVGMEGFLAFRTDVLRKLVQEAGFEEVEQEVMSPHIVPMFWLFYVFGIVLYMMLKVLGLQVGHLNIAFGVLLFRYRASWRYVQITGRKPV